MLVGAHASLAGRVRWELARCWARLGPHSEPPGGRAGEPYFLAISDTRRTNKTDDDHGYLYYIVEILHNTHKKLTCKT